MHRFGSRKDVKIMSKRKPDKRQEKEGTAKKQSPRYRHMMYAQQMKHMPFDSVKELFDHAEKKLNPVKLAVILHDKDRDENGNLKEPHVHMMMSFENARSLNSVAKLIGDKPQYIEKWDKNPGNGFSYLIHATDGAKEQYQYSADEVIANFNYAESIENTQIEIAAAKAKLNSVNPETLLDLLFQGAISKKEVEDRLTGSQYGKYHAQIEKVESKRLEREAERWREEMRRNKETVQTYWIYGRSGTGKTRHAKIFARTQSKKYYITGSSRDCFQNYAGENVIILDELRPRVMNFSDLLKILDPYSIDNDSPVTAPARYADKTLACKCFIITSPYDPYTFYDGMEKSNLLDSKVDLFGQLSRRITVVQKMTDTEIMLMQFDHDRLEYIPVEGTAKPNPYTAGQETRPNNILDIYNKFTSVAEKPESTVDIDVTEPESEQETEKNTKEEITENDTENLTE